MREWVLLFYRKLTDSVLFNAFDRRARRTDPFNSVLRALHILGTFVGPVFLVSVQRFVVVRYLTLCCCDNCMGWFTFIFSLTCDKVFEIACFESELSEVFIP